MENTRPVVVGITGASSSLLGFALVRALLTMTVPVELVITAKSLPVIVEEMGLNLQGAQSQESAIWDWMGRAPVPGLLTCFGSNQLGAPPASGTHLTRGMAVMPCSMGTLGKLAAGISDNLVCRAADVTLKERRPLVVVPRESPLNRIHLENMLKLHDAGATVIPPMISLYQKAFHSLDGQIAYTVGKVLDHLGLHDHGQFPRWTGPVGDAP